MFFKNRVISALMVAMLCQRAQALPKSCPKLLSLIQGRLVKEVKIFNPSELPNELSFKPPHLKHETEAKVPIIHLHQQLSELSTHAERVEFLRDFKLEDLILNPGHRVLRNPKKIRELASRILSGEYFKRAESAAKLHKTAFLNIHIESDRFVVDLCEGHHRIAAFYQAGYETLGEVFDAHTIQKQDIRIAVNGIFEADEVVPHRGRILPSYGLNFLRRNSFFPLEKNRRRGLGPLPYIARQLDGLDDPKNLIVANKNTNITLGSRETMQSIYEYASSMSDRPIRVGVVDAKSNAIPQDPDALADLLARNGLTDLVIIPGDGNEPSDILSFVLQANEKHFSGETRINIYSGIKGHLNWSGQDFIRRFDKKSLLLRIRQIYASAGEVIEISL